MTIFNRLKQAAEQAVEGASRGVDHLKLQSELGNVETQMERAFAEAGKRARYLHVHKQIVDADLGVILGQVDALEAQAMDLRAKLQAGQQPAPQHAAPTAAPIPVAPVTPSTPIAPAASDSAAPVAFRPPVAVAPAPAPEPEPPAAVADEALCPGCGARVAADGKFCGECGAKLA